MATANKNNADFTYIIIYLLEWLTGIVFFIIAGNDKRKKMHSIQAILLGVVALVLWVVLIFLGPIGALIDLLIWLYGLYVGYMASTGVDVEIPVITGIAKQYS